MKQGLLYTRALVAIDTYDTADNSIEVIFATETPILRNIWDGSFYEILSCQKADVRLDRFNHYAAVIDTHATDTIRNQIGVIKRAWIKDAVCYARIQLSTRLEWAGVVEDIKAGIIRNISVGYRVYKYLVNENIDGVPEYRAVDWEPLELTFCTVPADFHAITRSADHHENNVEIIFSNKNKIIMSTENNETPAIPPTPSTVTTSTNTPDTKTIDEATTAARIQERKRISEIRELVRIVDLEDNFADQLINSDNNMDQVRTLVIERKKQAQQRNNVRGQVTVVGDDEATKQRKGIEYALLNRADSSYTLSIDTPEALMARNYRGISLLDAAKVLLQTRGENVQYSKAEIVQRALTTSDFPALMSAIGNKFLRREYDVFPQTFKQFARQQNLPDFKEATGIQYGGTPTLEKLLEDSEYKYGTFSETQDGWKLATYGKIFRLTRQMIINDDLGAFKRNATIIARAAANLESGMVWALIVKNAKLSDGKALFHVDHSNLKNGGTLDVDGLSNARTAMQRQKGLSAEDEIIIIPKFLVVPPELQTKAEQLVSSIVANAAGEVNPFAGKLQPLTEPRLLNPKEWYLLSDFSTLDGITYGYLEGEEGLHTETKQGWESDGLEIKARIDFAAKCWDYKGFYKTVNQ